jgi:hypothetical protein
VSEHVLPALIKVGGDRLAADLMVLNFGLHFNTQSRSQQYLWHIGAVAKFVQKHQVSMAVECSTCCYSARGIMAPLCSSTRMRVTARCACQAAISSLSWLGLRWCCVPTGKAADAHLDDHAGAALPHGQGGV